MNKVTEFLYDIRKQKDDGNSCLQFGTITSNDNPPLFNKTANSNKMISKDEDEQSLKNQVNSFYNSINSSQPKELTSDAYRLAGYSETQCKSNKLQYKTSCSMNNERNNYSSATTVIATDKDVDREDKDDMDDSYVSDSETTDSDFSNLSGLSDLSGQEWKPITKSITWVQRQINSGVNPRDILSHFLSNGATISPNLNDMSLWRILAGILAEPPRRQKLRHINTIGDILQLLNESKNIIVLTGAGVSVSCGIPDFRSSDGIYSRLAKDFPDLPDPQAMFDINYFSRDPRPFYKFAREIYPGQFVPSPCHRFIKLLEKKQKLLRNYTQNIDTLEQVAGIKNVIECHGSFATASCTKCKYKTTADAIRDDIFAQRIPLCPKCHPSGTKTMTSTPVEPNPVSSFSELVQSGIMKPDIVFFGEGLPDAFHSAMASDKDKCDLLIVIGSSLKVRPVALIPSSIPSNVPQILINREQLNHLEFDVELLGDSDIIINQLCHLLGEEWREVCWDSNMLTESRHLKINPMSSNPVHVSSIDTDSQSTKSAITTNSSSAVFCDSGFDSSSSLHATQNTESEHQQQQHEKNPELRRKDSCSIQTNDDRITIFGTETSSSQTDRFARLEKNLSLRHLSVDSSKDSGICDSSNSVPLSGCTNLHIDEDDGEDNVDIDDRNDLTDEYHQHRHRHHHHHHHRSNRKISVSSPNTSYMSLNKSISVAERLQDNTYYYNLSTCSYVFPGAQVYWSSDSEYDEDGDDADDDDDFDRKLDLNTSGESKDKPNDDNDNSQNDESDDDSPPSKRRRDFSMS